MGFYFRKSARFGPFRVNFSTSGVGVSIGIPGFRIGTGPRGNYVQAGAHGFYYRATLSSARPPRVVPGSNRQPIPAQQPENYESEPDHTLAAFRAIESGGVEQMVDSSSGALLQEIRSKHSRFLWWRVSASLGVALAVLIWSNAAPVWACWVVVALASCATLLTYRWDLQRKLTVLHYGLNSFVTDAFTAMTEACTKLQACQGIWHLKGRAEVLDRKYHAGAAHLVSRAAAAVGRQLPPFMISNIDPVTFALSKITLYCFPDRILVYRDNDVGAIAYEGLGCESNDSRFIEDGAPPSDAKVVGHTWRYVNKSGGPDRRFNNNRQLAICEYDELTLRSGSGLNEILQLSRATVAASFVSAAKALTSAGRGGTPASARNSAFGKADANRSPEAAPPDHPESQTDGVGTAVRLAIAASFFIAGGITAYFHSASTEPNQAPPASITYTAPVPATVPRLKPRPTHDRPRAVEAAAKDSVAKVSGPKVPSSSSSTVEAVTSERSALAPSVTTTADDLAEVRARDAGAAQRIETYCLGSAATAHDPGASMSACHRSEIAAWTRLVVDQEFPDLDETTLATCGQPPFPDNYEGREACAKYQLHIK
jgi:hypothetical protein